LHNLGFDDLSGADAEEIHKIEDQILGREGFGVVYNSENKK